MGKKNKNKNNNNGQISKGVNTSVKDVVAPTIVVRPSNEILTTEEGEKLLQESLVKMEEYCELKRIEANEYLEKKRKEADSLLSTAEEQISTEVDKAVKLKEKEMKDQLKEATEEAKKIVKDAKTEAEKLLKSMQERESELNKKIEEHAIEITRLEASKISYKQEVLEKIQQELDLIKKEKNDLQEKIDELTKDLKKKEIEISSLEEDNSYYEEELSNNSIKKSQITSYEIRIKDLQANYDTINELYTTKAKEVEELRRQILLYGDDPAKALKENEELTRRVRELQNLVSNCPSADELNRLRDIAKKYEEVVNKLDLISAEKLALESKVTELKVSKDELETYRRFIKILELQKAELQSELDRNIELYNNSTEKVFASLSEIDKQHVDEYPSIIRTQGITLRDICQKFKGYLANRNDKVKLYYTDTTIRTFIAGFASSRLMILEGLSGTGKSSLPRAFQDFIGAKTIEVPVQSSWKDRNDLLGFYNDFKKQYKETEFLKALYEATHNPNRIYCIVLDEMNLSRIEYYFADLLSVLEKPDPEDWMIELISDYASISGGTSAWPKLIHEGKLQISDNTWFIGTANKDDSTFIITDKVYDRSVVLNFDSKGVNDSSTSMASPINLNNTDFLVLLESAKKNFSIDDKKRYSEMLKYLDNEIKSRFQITFGNRIANQLEMFVPVYIACGGTVDEAVDVMFSRKVLRKLEGIYDENTKIELADFAEQIAKVKGYKMPISIDSINKMVEKL